MPGCWGSSQESASPWRKKPRFQLLPGDWLSCSRADAGVTWRRESSGRKQPFHGRVASGLSSTLKPHSRDCWCGTGSNNARPPRLPPEHMAWTCLYTKVLESPGDGGVLAYLFKQKSSPIAHESLGSCRELRPWLYSDTSSFIEPEAYRMEGFSLEVKNRQNTQLWSVAVPGSELWEKEQDLEGIHKWEGCYGVMVRSSYVLNHRTPD